MRNWVNVLSLKNVLNNIVNPEGQIETFRFGKNEAEDQKFFQDLKTSLLPITRQKLGILTISNADLMGEVKAINQGILQGIPRREIIEQCDDSECIEEVDVPGEGCPPQETIENVTEEIQEVCSTDQLTCPPQPPPQPTPCTFDDCSAFAKKQCSSLIDTSKKE